MRYLNFLTAVCAIFALAACETDSPVGPPLLGPAVYSRASETSGIAATAVSTSEIDLSWQNSSTQVNGFQVFRSTTGATGSYSLIASTTATVTSYADVGLTDSSPYCYEVRSFRRNGRNTSYSAYSEAACATTKLGSPSGTEAMPVSSSNIRVSWTDNSANEDGFRVEQASSVDGPWSVAGTSAVNQTSLVLSVASDQRVCYRVLAFNAAENSLATAPVCTAALAAPTNLVAAPASDGIDVTWQDNSALEFGYVLQQATDGVTFTTLARLHANTVSFHQPGVGNTTSYWYRVVATRDAGLSDVSNTASTTGACVATGDEVCDNSVDDNCDGLVDGADPACGELVDCNFNPCGSGTICVPVNPYDLGPAWCQSSCADGFRDSDEADVDCGGGCGSTCQSDQLCWGNYDCASDNCVYAPGAFQGVCQPPVSQP